jgi:hypothetical protein
VTIQPLLDKLDERRAALARLDHDRMVLIAQIAAYEDAVRLLNTPAASITGAAGTLAAQAPAPHREPSKRSGVRLSKVWAHVLGSLGTAQFGYDDIMQMSDIFGFGIKRNVARSQMKLYTDSGLVERVSDGKFRVTPAGKQAADGSLKTEEALPGMLPDNASKPEA